MEGEVRFESREGSVSRAPSRENFFMDESKGDRVTQLLRQTTPFSAQSVAVARTLAPVVVENAVLRLRWISLSCAVLTVALLLLETWLQPEVLRLRGLPSLLLFGAVIILSSIGIIAVERFRLLSPVGTLNLGLAFEVIVAAAISFSETALLGSPGVLIVGCSKVALWIAIMGLLIPNKPSRKLLTALVSASTWPLAYFANLHMRGLEPLPLSDLVMWLHIPYLTAILTFAISKRIYHMESAVEKARELGSYQLIELIGAGGMGQVWRARHRMLAREAAIKLIRSDLLVQQAGHEPELTRQRLKREATAIASLQSPHTVFVFDFGISRDGSFYYVMELLDGMSLEDLVHKHGPQPASRVIHFLRQTCESLEEAHKKGLIHRDIKPSNIFFCKTGIAYDFVKVLDFGLVKQLEPSETLNLTIGGTCVGTPAYMAPEVALGQSQLDGRVDIYGLGCVAYFLLTGSQVFKETTATAAAIAHVQKIPIPPSQATELPIPAELEEIVLRCLEKKPGNRPASARELNRLLAAITVTPEWTPESAEKWWELHCPSSPTGQSVTEDPTTDGCFQEVR